MAQDFSPGGNPRWKPGDCSGPAYDEGARGMESPGGNRGIVQVQPTATAQKLRIPPVGTGGLFRSSLRRRLRNSESPRWEPGDCSGPGYGDGSETQNPSGGNRGIVQVQPTTRAQRGWNPPCGNRGVVQVQPTATAQRPRGR